MNLHFDPSSKDITSYQTSTQVPQHMFQLRSQWNLTGNWEFDQSLSFAARLMGTTIPAITRLDARLGRRIGQSAEVSLVGQNLLRPRTLEFPDVLSVNGTEAQRSVFGKITWTF